MSKINRETINISEFIIKLNNYIGKRYWTVCCDTQTVVVCGEEKDVDRFDFSYVEVTGFDLSKLTIDSKDIFEFHIKTKCLYSTLDDYACTGLCASLGSIFYKEDLLESHGFRQDPLDLEIDIELEKCDAYLKKDWRDFLKIDHKEIENRFPKTEYKSNIIYNLFE